MKIKYLKYSATGNILLLIDARSGSLNKEDVEFWRNLCSSEEADGVVFLEESKVSDFKMVYLNSDGKTASMCGNGLRAITHFAYHQLEFNKKKFEIETEKNTYQSEINSEEVLVRMVELYDIGKIDLTSFYDFKESLYLNTGVPHCVFLCEEVEAIDVGKRGEQIAHNRRFKNGSNVNFVEVIEDGKVKVRTYEIGVERETFSCGTGAMAVASALNKVRGWVDQIELETKGGKLLASFDSSFENLSLKGFVEKISEGELS